MLGLSRPAVVKTDSENAVASGMEEGRECEDGLVEIVDTGLCAAGVTGVRSC